jgi:hypothetical protein
MKSHLFALLRVLLTAVCFAGPGYGQSTGAFKADSLQPYYEPTPTYPRINRHFKYQVNGRNLKTPEILDYLSCVDSTALRQYKKGRKIQKIGVAIISFGGSLMALGELVLFSNAVLSVFNSGNSNDESTVQFLMVSGGVIIGAGLIQCILGGDVKREAINTYNMQIKGKETMFYVKPGLTGLSLGLRF